jgi:hypothetical protein
MASLIAAAEVETMPGIRAPRHCNEQVKPDAYDL